MTVESCVNCGEKVDVNWPRDPEVMVAVVCSKDCAREAIPLPSGVAPLFGSEVVEQ